MEYLADTVALIRYFSEFGSLGAKAEAVLAEADSGEHIIWISIISPMEIMYLAEKNRIPLTLEKMRELLESADNLGLTQKVRSRAIPSG